MNTEKRTIEIYALAKNLENVNVEADDGMVKVTVDLSVPKAEEEHLEKLNLMSPIREAEKFKAIKEMKYSKALLKANGDEMSNEEIAHHKRIITDGEKAVDELMVVFWPSAFNFAKNWRHNDRLNELEDWDSIIRMNLFDAIMTYDLDKQVQFNTYLNFQIKRGCKEEKCHSSILSVNPSAMHKNLQIQKAKNALRAEGKDEEDIDLIAEKIGRDISTPNKRENLRKTLIDMNYVSPQGISTESCVDSSSRTFGESIQSESIDPYDELEIIDLKMRFKRFFSTLDKETRMYIINFLNSTKKVINNEKVAKKLRTREFQSLILEAQKYINKYDISFLDFLQD